MFKQAITAILALVVLLPICSGDASATPQHCFTVLVNGVAKRVCEDAPAWESWGGANLLSEWDCRSGSCNPCGTCHTVAKARARPIASALAHVSQYKYTLKTGERVPWGDGGVVLGYQGGSLCILKGSVPVHCFPQSAYATRTPKGGVAGVVTPARATVVPPKAPTLVVPRAK